ncbi:MAG: MATE family efflux transporter [Romboutsia sp.]|nr:MATE family efflux transporter [Romboutsia sp.]
MRINKLAIPLMLNSISSTIINLCDQAMVGRTYLEGFASVGIIGSNIYSITGVLGAITIGFNILGSKAKGRDDNTDLNNSLFCSIIVSVIIGCIFFGLCIFMGEYILQNYFNIYGHTLKDATLYLRIFSLSLGINLVLFNISSYFKIMNKTKYILYGNIISCVSNVLFDYILIFGKFGFSKLGIVGNAIGSVLSLILGVVFYTIIIKKYKLISNTKVSLLKNAKEILKIYTPIMLQEFVESTIVVFMMNYILSQIGMLEVSIYNLLFSIINIALMPMYAYSNASLNIISEDIGAKNTTEIYKTIKSCVFRAIGFYCTICIVILIFKSQVPMIITNNTDLIINSSKYILIVITANIINIPSCILKSSMQALGEEKVVFIYSSIISILSTFLIYILVCILNGGLNSVYTGLMINYSVLTAVLLKRFYMTKKRFIVKYY